MARGKPSKVFLHASPAWIAEYDAAIDDAQDWYRREMANVPSDATLDPASPHYSHVWACIVDAYTAKCSAAAKVRFLRRAQWKEARRLVRLDANNGEA